MLLLWVILRFVYGNFGLVIIIYREMKGVYFSDRSNKYFVFLIVFIVFIDYYCIVDYGVVW